LSPPFPSPADGGLHCYLQNQKITKKNSWFYLFSRSDFFFFVIGSISSRFYSSSVVRCYYLWWYVVVRWFMTRRGKVMGCSLRRKMGLVVDD
jgi:hypothetical protein